MVNMPLGLWFCIISYYSKLLLELKGIPGLPNIYIRSNILKDHKVICKSHSHHIFEFSWQMHYKLLFYFCCCFLNKKQIKVINLAFI